jgi:DNA-3-methyladenine glycosylase
VTQRTSDGIPLRPLVRAFFARPALEVARDLLGCILVHDTPEGRVAGRVVECEAYNGSTDPGSHGYRGQTPRNAPMFEEPGRWYVYFTYGNHWCMNAVTGRKGEASAVLLRAVEPIEGVELMRARRGMVKDRDIARGPGRLTQSFGVSKDQNRLDTTKSPLLLCAGERYPEEAIASTPRIGLGTTQDGRLWRFHVAGSPWVSTGPMTAKPPRKRQPRD